MNKLKIILLILTLTMISCKEELESVLEVDYKVIQVHHYFNIVEENPEPIIIKERNFIQIEVNEKGECKIEKKIVEDSLMVSALKEYLIGNPENNHMPITIEKDFKYSGKVVMNKNFLVSAKFNKELNYKKYSSIRNKIYLAFNEVRNEFAKEKFNKTFKELINSEEENDELKLNEIREIFPFIYSEVIP